MTSQPTLPRSAYVGKLQEFPDIAFTDQGALQHRGKWSEFFQKRIGTTFSGELILEIGCFDAALLSAIAAEHPAAAFVGIDWKCKAIYDGAKRIFEHALPNIVLLRARGQDLLKLFAQAEVDEIWIFHPDPCDKQAERKNRLIAPSFLDSAHTILKSDSSTLTLKTDFPDYYRSVLDLLESSNPFRETGFEVTANSTDYWHDQAALSHSICRYFAGKTTMYENRFLKRQQRIFFVEMQKKERDPIEQ